MSNSHTYYIYILRCSDRSLYVGHTSNLKNRLFWHYQGFASQYTARRRPVTLTYSEVFQDEQSAISRELQLKSWSRLKKEALINCDLGRLKELSRSRD
jgi:predicted GIY-YIG superfamily endonuclease